MCFRIFPALLILSQFLTPITANEQEYCLDAAGIEVLFARQGNFTLKKGGKKIAEGEIFLWGKGWELSTQSEAVSYQGFPERLEEGGYVFKGVLEERASKRKLIYTQLVKKEGKEIIFDFRIEAGRGMSLEDISFCLGLPVPLFEGGSFELGNVKDRFPENLGSNFRLAKGEVMKLTVTGNSGNMLVIRFPYPCYVSIQDARKWQRNRYEIFIHIPRPKKLKRSQILRLLFGLSFMDLPEKITADFHSRSEGKLAVKSVEIPQKRIGRFRLLEVTVRIGAAFSNPFDPGQITLEGHFFAPNGEEIVAHGFFFQDFERFLFNGNEVLVPCGKPCWKVRFTPQETGKYRFFIAVRDKYGSICSTPYTFNVISSSEAGFIRVSETNPHYFAFDNGRSYFAIGHNVCWYSSGRKTFDYDEYFSRMSKAKENYSRVWMAPWSAVLEKDRVNIYRLDNAWRLDYLLDQARKNGIYIQLCLDNFWNLTTENPYSKSQGGPCGKALDFFTSPEARKFYRHRLRYIVSRWGYSPNVLAWQLWNEMDHIDGYDPFIVRNWIKETADYLKTLDPFQHLISTSLGPGSVDTELWNMKEMDFVQVHGYVPRNMRWLSKSDMNMSQLVRSSLCKVSVFNKPYLMSEFGFMDGKSKYSVNKLDKEGIHLHNGIWASVMSGSAGTAMIWWWDNYVHPNNLYFHYYALSNFVEGIDWAGSEFEPAVCEISNRQLEVLGLRNEKEGIGWIHNKMHTWYYELYQAYSSAAPKIKGASITILDVRDGKYEIEWWDTYNGKIIKKEYVKSRKSRLTIDIPSFRKDIAFKFIM